MKHLRKLKGYLVTVVRTALKLEKTWCARLAMIVDIIHCQLKFHITVKEYRLYKLYNYKDRYRKNFILFHHQKHSYRRVNDGSVTGDKFALYKELSEFYGRKAIMISDCGEEEFLAFAKEYKKVILKPLKGSLGQGVFVLQYEDEEQIRKYFRELTDEMVCEEYIIQHSKMSELNPTTVNTVRVISIRHDDENVEIAAITLKMGAKEDTVVDNMGHGGLIALVDLKTGIVTSFGMDKNRNQYARHPVTGVQIIGMNIPNWAAVIALVKKAHLKLDRSRVLGWDIAVTETGAVIVEANSAPAPSILQIIDNAPKGEKVLEVLNNKEYQVYNN